MTRGWPAFFLLGATVSTAAAQQSVSGTVRDVTRQPIAGADVLIGSRNTTTTATGVFRIDSLQSGNLPLTVRAVGFRPLRQQLTLKDRPLELNILLEPSMAQLPEIIVVARRTGIYGTVGDPATGPNPGARVEVVGRDGGVQTTDSAGRFAFPEADRGDYFVVVTLAGYEQRRIALRIDDGKGRQLAIQLTAGTVGSGTMDAWAFGDLRERLVSWPARTRMTRADFEKFGEVKSLCDVARVQYEAGTGATVILNGTLRLENWPLCDIMVNEIELIEFASVAPTGRRRGAAPTRGGIIYVWERR